MPSRRPGPKMPPAILDLTGLPDAYPDRAFALLADIGYTPYRWQREELLLLIDPDTRPALAYIQVARKNGKTALAVMVALCELFLQPDRHIYGVSDSERNLSSVFWLELNTALRRNSYDDYVITTQSTIECVATGSFIQMRPGNFAASQGINPHLVIADEVHLIKPPVWHGYLMSTAARENAMVLGITTPGYNLDSSAHELYLEAKAGTDPDLHSRIFEPEDPDCDPADGSAWRQSNPALDEIPPLLSSLRKDIKRTPEHDFRRFRLGQWTATEKAWFPYGAFRACASTDSIPLGARVVLGFDGSWSGDTTALVACDTEATLQVLGHWAPPVMDSGQWRVDMSAVEQMIRNACAIYDVEEIVCDPARWGRNIQALSDEGLPMIEYPQSPSRMIRATTLFYDAVMDRTLRYCDNHLGPTLVNHVGRAEVKESDKGSMIVKPTFAPAAGNIDCAIAAIMAHDRAVRLREATDCTVEWVTVLRT